MDQGPAGEEVTDFLQRIRELGDRRDREDDERARQLEAEIIAGREARRARRDERARSISPQKDLPVLPGSTLVLSPTDADDFASGTNAALEKLSGKLQDVTVGAREEAKKEEVKETVEEAATRRPVPSWQRRDRPKSAHVPHSSLLSRNAIADEVRGERREIAEKLGQKEPAWFRQTTERLEGSKALRRGGEEMEGGGERKELPGMRKEEVVEAKAEPRERVETPPPAEAPQRSYRTRAQSVHAGRFELSAKDLSQPPPMSPSQGRIEADPERTPSPTKGYGGFVQSAMLKREGSVNKRWSTQQTPTTVSRNGTVVKARPKSFHQSMVSRDQIRSQLSVDSRDSSPAPDEQSSAADDSTDASGRGRAMSTSSFMSDAAPRSDSLRRGQTVRRDSSPPAMSPSQKWEQKRWSPTKSSWLESALKKGTDQAPVKSKPKGPIDQPPILRPTPATSPAPATRTGEKSKGPIDQPPILRPTPSSSPAPTKPLVLPIKTSEKTPEDKVEPTKPSAATPPKPEKLSLARSAFESPTTYRRSPSPEKFSSVESSPKYPPRSGSPEKESVQVKRLMGPTFAPRLASRSPSPEKLEIGMGKLELGSPTAKSVADLRAGLRPRAQSGADNTKELPAFLNARQSLRSTKTQNYKAPNELKERILEGKAHLAATGGPQKTVRPDPLKETVLSAKGSLRNSRDLSNFQGFPSPETRAPEKKFGSRMVETKPEVVEKPVLASKPSFPKSEPSTPKSVPEPRPLPVKKSSFADKFNPGLAGMLMRGPPPMGGPSANKPTASVAIKQSEPTEPSGPLKHMTKGRAKGPKRRAPTTAAVETTPTPAAKRALVTAPAPAVVIPKTITKPVAADSPSTPQRQFSYTLDSKFESKAAEPLPVSSVVEEKATPAKTKPPTPVKSPLLRGNSSSSLKENAKLDDNSPIRSATPPLVRKSSATVLLKKASQTSLSASSPLGTKLQATVEEDFAQAASKLEHTPIHQRRDESNGALSVSTPTPRKVSLSPLTEPKPARPLPPFPAPSPKMPLSPTTPSKIGIENSQLLSEFFRGPMFKAPKVEFDIIDIITSKPSIPTRRVRTARMEVSLIQANGQMSPIPVEQEHVFYDEAMYVCLHTFESFPGQHEAEVFLWTGGKVSPSETEDVQLFARRLANNHDGRMIHIHQGRETAEFFEAIGGILVTLRGTHKSSPASSNFLLCGRSIIGGVAFDEVNMEFAGLCSGFCYLLRFNGKMYMWKGRGTAPEEIGVAKIVGFEIGQDEIVECSEGQETPEFLAALGGGSSRTSAEYWNLRPACRKYGTRLFKIDLQEASGVKEIVPFSQLDLDPKEIYVADAYFEFYIVLGAQSQSKRAEFQTALQFAQEYSMLAVSLEDRPVIPVTSVILGGAPREFKALFRGWEDGRMSAPSWMPMRKPSLRIVGLSEAMEAVGV